MDGGQRRTGSRTGRAAPGQDVAAAIADNFAGDEMLYAAFAVECERQFAADAEAGDAAGAAGDLATLRRLAHNVKSALRMIGRLALSAGAAEVEQLAAAGDLPAARAARRRLRRAWPSGTP